MSIVEGNYTVEVKLLNRRSAREDLPPDVLTCAELLALGITDECCAICHLKADVGWSEDDIEEEMGIKWMEDNYNGIHTIDDTAHLLYADTRAHLCCGCEARWYWLSGEQRAEVLERRAE